MRRIKLRAKQKYEIPSITTQYRLFDNDLCSMIKE